MMAAKGAIRPVYEIMEAAGTPVDTSKLLGSVASYYSSHGKLIACLQRLHTVLYYNKDAVKKAGATRTISPRRGPKWPNSPRRSRIRRVQVRPHLRLAVLGAA